MSTHKLGVGNHPHGILLAAEILLSQLPLLDTHTNIIRSACMKKCMHMHLSQTSLISTLSLSNILCSHYPRSNILFSSKINTVTSSEPQSIDNSDGLEKPQKSRVFMNSNPRINLCDSCATKVQNEGMSGGIDLPKVVEVF